MNGFPRSWTAPKRGGYSAKSNGLEKPAPPKGKGAGSHLFHSYVWEDETNFVETQKGICRKCRKVKYRTA